MTQEPCFAFVINHLELQFDLPIEIAPGYYLQKANDEQIETFREFLNRLIGFTPYRELSEFPYERSHTHLDENGPDVYTLSPLERDQWKYYIINTELADLSKERFVDLQLASNMSDIELVFDSFIFIPGKTNRTFYHNPNILQRFIADRRLLPPQTIQQEDVQQIGDLYNLMRKTEDEDSYQFIKKSIILFDSLRNLPIKDDLRILGLFTVIESLVTHRPGKTETYDSLTHQVSSKLPLMSRRFDRKLNYNKFFDTNDERTIWKKLYQYRSNIAHGRESTVKGNLKILRSRSNIYNFMHLMTKLLLVQSLKEPRLVTDLKQC